jgi:hypothetical protein
MFKVTDVASSDSYFLLGENSVNPNDWRFLAANVRV